MAVRRVITGSFIAAFLDHGIFIKDLYAGHNGQFDVLHPLLSRVQGKAVSIISNDYLHSNR
jgi:hypothetical protein